MTLIKKTAIAAVMALCPFMAQADDITDAINEGLQGYKSGDLAKAAAQLDYASTLIRQKKSEKIIAVFPEPKAGWQADEPQSEAGAAMMGGGITAERQYSKGDAYIDIKLVMDSPMMQSMMAMFSNPAMIAMGGGKVIKVQGNSAKLDVNGDQIEITLIVNNNAMITISGQGASLDDVKSYANGLLLNKL